MTQYKCDSCKTHLETDDSLGGKQEACPVCGRTNPVPIISKNKGPRRDFPKLLKHQFTTFVSLIGLGWVLGSYPEYSINHCFTNLRDANGVEVVASPWVGVKPMVVAPGEQLHVFVEEQANKHLQRFEVSSPGLAWKQLLRDEPESHWSGWLVVSARGPLPSSRLEYILAPPEDAFAGDPWIVCCRVRVGGIDYSINDYRYGNDEVRVAIRTSGSRAAKWSLWLVGLLAAVGLAMAFLVFWIRKQNAVESWNRGWQMYLVGPALLGTAAGILLTGCRFDFALVPEILASVLIMFGTLFCLIMYLVRRCAG